MTRKRPPNRPCGIHSDAWKAIEAWHNFSPAPASNRHPCECTRDSQRRRKNESKGWQTLLRRLSLIVTHNFSRAFGCCACSSRPERDGEKSFTLTQFLTRDLPRSRSVPIASIQASIPVLSWIFRFFSSFQANLNGCLRKLLLPRFFHVASAICQNLWHSQCHLWIQLNKQCWATLGACLPLQLNDKIFCEIIKVFRPKGSSGGCEMAFLQ